MPKPPIPADLLDRLVVAATDVRSRAYAPYSGYAVGAAVASKQGNVYVGCNVENASYGSTVCAERVALFSMVAAGDRKAIACAVVTRDGGAPCGACRQVLAEFAGDIPIAVVAAGTKRGKPQQTGEVVGLRSLFPAPFVLRRP